MKAPPYRLLALDIDGTLLRRDKTVSARTHSALRAARASGVRLVLVTGRRYPAARRVAEGLGGEIDLVLHNGALIVTLNAACLASLDELRSGASRSRSGIDLLTAGPPRTGDASTRSAAENLGATRDGAAILRCRPLPRELALRSIRIGRERRADPVVHSGLKGEGRLLVEGVAASNTLLTYYLDKSHPDVLMVPDLEAAVVEDPLQVMFGGGIEEMNALLPHLTSGLGEAVRIERTVYAQMGVGILDVLAAGVSKAEAVAFLQDRRHLPFSQTLAIGDNWNDREMLERAGLGLLMGNADPDMLRLGFPVLPTNEEDGVAVAIEERILEPLRAAGREGAPQGQPV